MGPILNISDIMCAFDERIRTLWSARHKWRLLFATRPWATFACTTEWRVT